MDDRMRTLLQQLQAGLNNTARYQALRDHWRVSEIGDLSELVEVLWLSWQTCSSSALPRSDGDRAAHYEELAERKAWLDTLLQRRRELAALTVQAARAVNHHGGVAEMIINALRGYYKTDKDLSQLEKRASEFYLRINALVASSAAHCSIGGVGVVQGTIGQTVRLLITCREGVQEDWVLAGGDDRRLREVIRLAFDHCGRNANDYDTRVLMDDFPGGLPTPRPCEGDSFELPIFLGVVACVRQQPVSLDIIVTGRVQSNGKVIHVEGVEAKAAGAFWSGAKKLIVPREDKAQAIDGIDKSEALAHKTGRPTLGRPEIIPISTVQEAIEKVFGPVAATPETQRPTLDTFEPKVPPLMKVGSIVDLRLVGPNGEVAEGLPVRWQVNERIVSLEGDELRAEPKGLYRSSPVTWASIRAVHEDGTMTSRSARFWLLNPFALGRLAAVFSLAVWFACPWASPSVIRITPDHRWETRYAFVGTSTQDELLRVTPRSTTGQSDGEVLVKSVDVPGLEEQFRHPVRISMHYEVAPGLLRPHAWIEFFVRERDRRYHFGKYEIPSADAGSKGSLSTSIKRKELERAGIRSVDEFGVKVLNVRGNQGYLSLAAVEVLRAGLRPHQVVAALLLTIMLLLEPAVFWIKGRRKGGTERCQQA